MAAGLSPDLSPEAGAPVSNDIQIRTVTVELMRPGPAHNQLLSPLTQYLGICGDAEAGVVTQPYEHASFLERMKAMRYEDGQDEGSRRSTLRELGQAVGRVLGSIPCLPGALTADPGGPDTLIHLRLVLTPSELATLPFELSKVPVSAGTCTESWLSLQAGAPVVITRRTRNVSSAGVKWPLEPRILFVSAAPDDVPFDEHRQALLDALEPFRLPGRDDGVLSEDGRRETFGHHLTILKDARYDDLLAECAQTAYTHVHVLAHGGVDPGSVHTSYGLLLNDQLITGERLASALTVLTGQGKQCPSVVTLATCESANAGSVLIPGGSIAHVLHQEGIALVVASQVPLSKQGSTLLVRELYRGLLWCERPWVLLHRVRKALHGRLGALSHDWASLVVYDTLPQNLDSQLEDGRYLRAKAANRAAFEHLKRAAAKGEPLGALTDTVLATLAHLPELGRYASEGLGLRASSFKQLAQIEFEQALRPDCAAPVKHVLTCAKHLHQSLHHYEQAVQSFLVNGDTPVQRVATLHWVLVQQICLSAVLGKTVPEGSRQAARLSAEAYLEQPDLMQRAWALGSLAELALLDLERVTPGAAGDAQRRALNEAAQSHVRALIRLARRLEAPYIVDSTLAQFRRYADWWGSTLLENVVISLDLDERGTGRSRAAWDAQQSAWTANGIVALATELAEMLDERSAAERTERAAMARPAVRLQAAAAHEASVRGLLRAAVSAQLPIRETVAAVDTASPAPAPSPSDTSSMLGQAASPSTLAAKTASAGKAAAGKLAGKTAAKTASKSAARASAAGAAFLHVDMLPADHGDCLWIEYGRGQQVSRVLVDCGTPRTFESKLRPRIEALPATQRHFELFVLSHIDADHIGGAIPFMEAAPALGITVGDVWFNGWKHIKAYDVLGAKQAEIFSAQLERAKWPWNRWQDGGTIVLPDDGPLPTCTLPGGLTLTLLSPNADKLAALAAGWRKDLSNKGLQPGEGDQFLAKTTGSTSTDVPALAATAFKPDTAENNGSSITLLAEFAGKSVLLGADCHAPLLVRSIRRLLQARGLTRLPLGALKLPHHGSRNNVDRSLIEVVDCRHYLVSSNGKQFGHPDREALARCIHHGTAPATLHFNYRSDINAVWADPALRQRYGYDVVYPPAGQEGLRVTIE